MGLIKCPSCGGRISDMARRCVHCGMVFETGKVGNEQEIKKSINNETNEVLIDTDMNSIQDECDIYVKNLKIIKDINTGKIYLKCLFHSLSPNTIQAIIVDFYCKDTWGNTTTDIKDYQYLDLSIRNGQEFGGAHMVELPDDKSRLVDVRIRKIRYLNGGIRECIDSINEFKDQELIKEVLPDELYTTYIDAIRINIYKRIVGIEMNRFGYKYLDDGRFWYCSCGEVNNQSNTECTKCGNNRVIIAKIQNPEYLRLELSKKNRLLEEKRMLEERERERLVVLCQDLVQIKMGDFSS